MGKYDPDDDRLYQGTGTPVSGGKYAPSSEPITSAEAPPKAARTWWDTARNVGQTADDAVRAAANAVTFGMADRFAGAMNAATDTTPRNLSSLITGKGPLTYEDAVNAQVKLSEEARKRSPYASIVGDVGGALALPGMGGAGLSARLGSGWGARALGFGAEGAGIGALQGAGNTYTGKPLDYITNAATGGAMGGILGAGMGAAFGPRTGPRSTAETPTTPQLYAEKNRNYLAVENSPVPYEASALARAADPVEQALRAQRFHQNESPRSFQALDEMRAPPTTAHLGPGAPVYPADIEFIRKGMSNLNPITERTDIASARQVRQALNDFVLNPPPGAVYPGFQAAARDVSAMGERARGNYGGYKRGQFLDDLVNNAQNTAGATHSGLNLMNELRKGARSAVKQTEGQSPASRVGMNDAEIQAFTDYARGASGSNTLRWASKLLGGGSGLGAWTTGIGAGGATQYFKDDPALTAAVGFGAPALGLGLRMLGNRRADTEIRELGNMLRQRTPLYQERAAIAPMGPPGGTGVQMLRDAITTELIKQGVGQSNDDPLRITVRP